MDKCPVCKKTFVDISEGCREILGCPKCGLYKEDAERVITHRKELEKPAIAPVEQETTPAQDSLKSDREWMRTLTLKMAQEHGIRVQVTWGKADSWCQPSDSKNPARIHYGARAIQTHRDRGFTEYVTQGWIWDDVANTKIVKVRTYRGYNRYVQTDLTGRKGLWAQVLHEFAHTEGHYHDRTWASTLQELKVLYPYNEVQSL